MKEITKYQSDDGVCFDTADEAIRHDSKLHKVSAGALVFLWLSGLALGIIFGAMITVHGP